MNKPSSNRIWPGLTYVGVPYVAGKTDMELTVTATSMSGVIANVRPLSLALDEDGGIAAPKKYYLMILQYQKNGG